MIKLRGSIVFKMFLLILGSTCIVLAVVVDLMYNSSRRLIREEAEVGASKSHVFTGESSGTGIPRGSTRSR